MSDKAKTPIWKKSLFVLSMLLVLAVILIPIIDRNFKSSLKPELKNFAVENPEEVTRIFMASKSNTSSHLELEKNADGVWMVDDSFPAEEEKVKMLVFEYLARLQARNPVPKTGLDGVLRNMAANAIKVEVYKGNQKDKVIYIGGNTADELATHMLLENSSMPFAVEIPGFKGYPGAIFNMSPKKWKSVNLFHTTILELKSVELEYPSASAASFRILKEDRSLKIEPLYPENAVIGSPDETFLKQYAATFESLTYESIYEGLAAKLADSIVHNTQPFVTIRLQRLDGKEHVLKIYKKPLTQDSPQFDNYGNPVDYDLDRFYGVLDGNTQDVLSVQSFVFKNILKRYQDFFPQQNPS